MCFFTTNIGSFSYRCNIIKKNDTFIYLTKVLGHAYSIMKLFKFTHSQKGNTVLLKLRNPWGKLEWKGDWSDDSPLWTEELKKLCGYKKRNDGIFFMAMTDFVNYFSDIAICYYHLNYQYASLRCQQPNRKKSNWCTFQVHTDGKYYFSIIQTSKRGFPRKSPYNYSVAKITLLRQSGQNQYDFVTSLQKRDREVWVEANLSPGVYVLKCKAFWNADETNQNVREYVISSYGPGRVNFQKCQKIINKVFC